jgi:hypothetical protein
MGKGKREPDRVGMSIGLRVYPGTPFAGEVDRIRAGMSWSAGDFLNPLFFPLLVDAAGGFPGYPAPAAGKRKSPRGDFKVDKNSSERYLTKKRGII